MSKKTARRKYGTSLEQELLKQDPCTGIKISRSVLHMVDVINLGKGEYTGTFINSLSLVNGELKVVEHVAEVYNFEGVKQPRDKEVCMYQKTE